MRINRVAQLLRWLPRPVLARLDGWSHQVALRRARARQQRWLQRQAAASSSR